MYSFSMFMCLSACVCVPAADVCFPFCVLKLELACQSYWSGKERETTGVGTVKEMDEEAEKEEQESKVCVTEEKNFGSSLKWEMLMRVEWKGLSKTW